MESDESGDDSFGGLLRMYRRRSGLSQIELAERARISSRAISDLERGVRSRAYHPTVEALASALSLRDDERQRFSSAVRRARSLSPSRSRIPPAEHDRRVQQVVDLMLFGQERLVSVTGPPGSGKTRLATQAGRVLAERQRAILEYVSLEGYADSSELLRIITPPHEAETDSGDRSGLAERRLVVLDNLEHLLPIDAEVRRLLRQNPGLSMIIVSRVPTQIAGEHEVALPPP